MSATLARTLPPRLTRACSIRTAKWTGECLIYTNAQNRIQYLVGEQTYTINHTDKCVPRRPHRLQLLTASA